VTREEGHEEIVESGSNPVRRWLLYFSGKTEGGTGAGAFTRSP